jgi:N-acyl homoserine lactone hydrolase
MIGPTDIHRLNLGHYTMPAQSRLPGQKIVCAAYVVRYPGGLLLFDSGIGIGHDQTEQDFSPMFRRPLQAELATLGLRIEDVTAVVNCHLHIDHCGGNPLFPGIPLLVQQTELDALPSLDYVMPEMVEFPGVKLEVHDGEAQIAPGLRLIPTPGHTPGHQSVLAETTQGRVLLAGQAYDGASDYMRALFTLEVADSDPAATRPWLAELRRLDVRRTLFAHDLLSWDKAATGAPGPG